MSSYIYEYRIRRVRRSCAAELASSVTGPALIAKAFSTFVRDEPRELFLCASLDTRNHCLGIEVVAIGTMNSVDVHPRETFRAAILAGAAAIVVAHNHPSGDRSPSDEDIALTRRLRECGDLLGIPLLDHLILDSGGYLSLAERGLL